MPKIENFKDFIEKSGVGEQIVKVLLDLFEKPERAENVEKYSDIFFVLI